MSDTYDENILVPCGLSVSPYRRSSCISEFPPLAFCNTLQPTNPCSWPDQAIRYTSHVLESYSGQIPLKATRPTIRVHGRSINVVSYRTTYSFHYEASTGRSIHLFRRTNGTFSGAQYLYCCLLGVMLVLTVTPCIGERYCTIGEVQCRIWRYLSLC